MFDFLKSLFHLFFSFKLTEETKGKPAWRSKTVWTNIILLLGVFFTKYTGIELSTTDVTALLAVINIILRLVTKSPTGLYEG